MLQPISREFAEVTTADQATAEAPAVSLILLSGTCLLFSLHHAGFFPFSTQVLGMGIFYGAGGMIAIGLVAWKRHNAYGAVLSTAIGLFWLSLVAMVIMPGSGFGSAPQPSALSSYLAFWGLFTSIFLTGASRLGRESVIFLSLFAVFLMLLAVGAAAESTLINAIAGGEGIACAMVGLYAGAARFTGERKNICPP